MGQTGFRVYSGVRRRKNRRFPKPPRISKKRIIRQKNIGMARRLGGSPV